LHWGGIGREGVRWNLLIHLGYFSLLCLVAHFSGDNWIHFEHLGNYDYRIKLYKYKTIVCLNMDQLNGSWENLIKYTAVHYNTIFACHQGKKSLGNMNSKKIK
jgi:hypothetical protein